MTILSFPRFSLATPGKCPIITTNYAMTASFRILSSPLLSNNCIIQGYTDNVTDCRVCSWPWQWFALRKADRPFIVTSNRCVPVKKNTLGWSAVVFCACNTIRLFCVVFYVIKTEQRFDFDIHMSVLHNIIPSYSQQDATFLDLFISKDALHVPGGSSAHHQEHTTVHTASGIVNWNYRVK